MNDTQGSMPMALQGVTVIDFTHHITGPYSTKLLADYGAEVIKIERPDGGDPARRMGPFFHDVPHLEGSGLFLHLNTNKKSVTLDLKTRTGRQIALDLTKQADIVVESFSPRVMPSLGLDYSVLAEVNPSLVMTSISNFGSSGPYRDYKMSEITLYAMGGTMYSTGVAGREPVKLGLTVEQFYAGMVAGASTMGAYMGAFLQGEGQHLDLSMFEIMATSQDRAQQFHASYQYTGTMNGRVGGGGGRNLLPNGAYPCADGYVQLFAMRPVWREACLMIERPDLIDDPHFTDNFTGNAEVKAEFDALLLGWLFSNTKTQVMEKAQAAGYICGVLNSMDEVFVDPHLRGRGFFVEVDHPYTGPLEYPGAQFNPVETPWRAGRAPLLGEHTIEVLTQRLGYAPEDVARLREQGAL